MLPRAELGFNIPTSVLGSEWPPVEQLAARCGVVFKSLRGGLQTRDENRIVFANPLGAANIAALAGAAQPWPGMFQSRIHGLREWRVTVVADHVLSAAVHLADGLVDWRKHQMSDAVRFSEEILGEPGENACLELTRKFGLGYAAIDLIEDREGSLWFLELNPNGQFGWLEAELGLPVSSAIADALVAIAGGGARCWSARPNRRPHVHRVVRGGAAEGPAS